MNFGLYEFISIVVATIAIIAIYLVFFVLYQRRIDIERHYDLKEQIAEIETSRKYFESKIYQLSERLASSEERWKDIHHILLSSQMKKPKSYPVPQEVRLSKFLQNVGISEKDLEIKKDLVFVLTPFHENMLRTYKIIEDVCKENGFDCLRGDEKFVEGYVFPHLLKLLVHARLVIANIDGRNPNVFYELGIAHAIDKPIILISKTVPDTAFDIKGKNILIYKNEQDLREKLKAEITKVLI